MGLVGLAVPVRQDRPEPVLRMAHQERRAARLVTRTPDVLHPSVAAHRGLTPAQRAKALDRAKGVCMQFAGAVLRGDAAMVQRLSAGLDWHELAALAVVLAAAADPVRLKVIKESDDGERTQVA